MATTEELFKLSNDMADYVAKNEEGFINYLKTASFTRHNTVSNQLLILSYLSSINGNFAKDVRDAETWNSIGISVRNDTYPIYIMEHDPVQPKIYKPRAVYDISQTNAAQDSITYDKGFVAEALLLSAPCSVEYTDNLKVKGTKAMYRPDSGKIEVTKGFRSYDEIVSNMAREYAHFYFHSESNKQKKPEEAVKNVYARAVHNEPAYAASFVVANAYGIDTSGYNFSHVPSSMGKYETKEIKHELNKIFSAAKNIMNNLDRQLERIYDMNSGIDNKEGVSNAR